MLLNIANYSGSLFIQCIRYVGSFTVLLVNTVYLSLVPPYKWERVLAQAKRVGPGSFLIACLVAFFIGMIMSLQMAYQMKELSAEIYIPGIVAISIARELAPVLTALIVAGRIGAGITAEIGSMTVTEQVDALKAFAVNPVKYLVVPRFLGLLLMLPLLTVFADLVGILGSYVICIYKLNISPDMFYNTVDQALRGRDIVTGLLKTLFFAGAIALVGCQQGLNVTGGADGVGKATTVSVVISFILIIMMDCFFTTLFYFIFRV